MLRDEWTQAVSEKMHLELAGMHINFTPRSAEQKARLDADSVLREGITTICVGETEPPARATDARIGTNSWNRLGPARATRD